MDETATRELDTQALEQILIGHMMAIAGEANQIFLQNWVTRLHDFLNLNERAILPDAGNVSRDEAHQLAEQGV